MLWYITKTSVATELTHIGSHIYTCHWFGLRFDQYLMVSHACSSPVDCHMSPGGDIKGLRPGGMLWCVSNSQVSISLAWHNGMWDLDMRMYQMHYVTKPCSGHVDGLVQERGNSSAVAIELRLSCTNPSMYVQWAESISCLLMVWWH